MLLLTKNSNLFKSVILSTLLLPAFIQADNRQNLFASVSAGYNSLNGDEVTSINLDSSGYNYTIELGYEISADTEITLNYQKIVNDNLSLDNYYIASNYKFLNVTSLTPYLGVTLGYSELTWDKNPINTNKIDSLSSSYIGGINIGTIYKINSSISLTMSYQLQYMNNHETSIKTSTLTGKLTHDMLNSFNIGVRYFF